MIQELTSTNLKLRPNTLLILELSTSLNSPPPPSNPSMVAKEKTKNFAEKSLLDSQRTTKLQHIKRGGKRIKKIKTLT